MRIPKKKILHTYMVVEINIKYLIVYVHVTSRNTSLETPRSLGASV